MKKILLPLLLIFLSVPSLASAHGIHYDPIASSYNNTITTNGAFKAKDTMSAAQIQTFLAGKGSALANWKETTDKTIGWNWTVNAKNMTAAQIIYNTAQWYEINPQVLLATLQKESSLVTSGTLTNLTYAMGYACPENNSCDPFYKGFSRQMDGAAYQFYYNYKYSELNDSRVGVYRKGVTATIDGKATYIANSATAAFYRYTPHRPDSAYLTATNGSHYYGNYNFIKRFNEWFPSYSYSFVSAKNPPSNLLPGQEADAEITIKNTGTAVWSADAPGQQYPMRLNVIFGSELKGTTGWAASKRIAMFTSAVNPGENAVFKFKVKMPEGGGLHKIGFVPVVENLPYQAGLADIGMQFHIFNPKGALYRFWSSKLGTHFYTANKQEKDSLITFRAATWKYEGIVGSVYLKGVGSSVPTYRFYSSKYNRHFYTANWLERESLVKSSSVWRLEGTVFYVYNKLLAENKPFYRFWSSSRRSHFYTASSSEKDYIIKNYPSWKYEGIAFYLPR